MPRKKRTRYERIMNAADKDGKRPSLLSELAARGIPPESMVIKAKILKPSGEVEDMHWSQQRVNKERKTVP